MKFGDLQYPQAFRLDPVRSQVYLPLSKYEAVFVGPAGKQLDAHFPRANALIIMSETVSHLGQMTFIGDDVEIFPVILQASPVDDAEPAEFTIPATCEDDDNATLTVQFDALPWFQQATTGELEELFRENWRECDLADDIAHFCRFYSRELARFFDSLAMHNGELSKLIGFTCRIDEGKALGWLACNRPDLEFLTPGDDA